MMTKPVTVVEVKKVNKKGTLLTDRRRLLVVPSDNSSNEHSRQRTPPNAREHWKSIPKPQVACSIHAGGALSMKLACYDGC